MVGAGGFEPPNLQSQNLTCCRLHHAPVRRVTVTPRGIWLRRKGSNLQSPGSEPGAFPVTLRLKTREQLIHLCPDMSTTIGGNVWRCRESNPGPMIDQKQASTCVSRRFAVKRLGSFGRTSGANWLPSTSSLDLGTGLESG